MTSSQPDFLAQLRNTKWAKKRKEDPRERGNKRETGNQRETGKMMTMMMMTMMTSSQPDFLPQFRNAKWAKKRKEDPRERGNKRETRNPKETRKMMMMTKMMTTTPDLLLPEVSPLGSQERREDR